MTPFLGGKYETCDKFNHKTHNRIEKTVGFSKSLLGFCEKNLIKELIKIAEKPHVDEFFFKMRVYFRAHRRSMNRLLSLGRAHQFLSIQRGRDD